jgi:hypothetical protein
LHWQAVKDKLFEPASKAWHKQRFDAPPPTDQLERLQREFEFLAWIRPLRGGLDRAFAKKLCFDAMPGGRELHPDDIALVADLNGLAANPLKHLRRKAGLKPEVLALLTGLDASHIKRIESGKIKRPNTKTRSELATALSAALGRKIEPSELLRNR